MLGLIPSYQFSADPRINPLLNPYVPTRPPTQQSYLQGHLGCPHHGLGFPMFDVLDPVRAGLGAITDRWPMIKVAGGVGAAAVVAYLLLSKRKRRRR